MRLLLLIMIVVAITLLIVPLFYVTYSTYEGEAFTELYFLGEIPKQLTPGEQYTFNFAIHNQEHQDMRYQYQIRVDNATVSNKIVTLLDGETRIVNAKVVLESGSEPSEVSVHLIDQNQEIHFWKIGRTHV